MGLNKERWASARKPIREGTDYSGIRQRFATWWLCRTCNTLVQPGQSHGHAR